MNSIIIEQGDCLSLIKKLGNNTIDCILTDPPYLYLKKQKLDRPFDEQFFFQECKRVLKNDGFIILFGRGTSFYRWNTILANMGFVFKEEIIWDKNQNTSPLMNLSRIHETISIHTKGDGYIKKSKVPYLHMKENDISSILQDVKRLRSVFANMTSMKAVEEYLKNNIEIIQRNRTANYLTISSTINLTDRCVSVVKSMQEGMIEKSIIRESRNRRSIHPTEKPVPLLIRLLKLVCDEGDTVLDPFSGSGSTGIACINSNLNFIGYEIDTEYYNKAKHRIDEAVSNKRTTLF